MNAILMSHGGKAKGTSKLTSYLYVYNEERHHKPWHNNVLSEKNDPIYFVLFFKG